jgi:transposase
MIKERETAMPSLALVFGYIAIKELQEPADRVEILSRLGYGIDEISKICGITKSTVGVIKFRNKNKKTGGKNAKKKNK